MSPWVPNMGSPIHTKFSALTIVPQLRAFASLIAQINVEAIRESPLH